MREQTRRRPSWHPRVDRLGGCHRLNAVDRQVNVQTGRSGRRPSLARLVG
jgi:hypothetical protein